VNSPDFNQVSLTAFLLTFIGGVATGLNPCCYTMIPAIVGYLGGHCAPSVKRCSWAHGNHPYGNGPFQFITSGRLPEVTDLKEPIANPRSSYDCVER